MNIRERLAAGRGAIPAAPFPPLQLTEDHRAEVLDFLAERPTHTFGMAGFIHSNGITSAHNRGSFYGYRGATGRLEGVALIGHHVLFETRCDAAIAAFAALAQRCPNAYMVLGEQETVQAFWRYYTSGHDSARLYCRELLFEQCQPACPQEPVPGLRLAAVDDLDLVVPAHAQTALAESGIDPLAVDPAGFRQRCARRVSQGKTWVWIENGRLLFKADIIADTPEVIYLEGIWVDPRERGKGYGLRCMSQLSELFLRRTASICLLVNDKFKSSHCFYHRAGFRFVTYYDTIYVEQTERAAAA